MSEDDRDGGKAFFYITNRDIWLKLEKMEDDVAEIKRVLPPLVEGRHDHELRMRKLELKFYGVVAGIAGVVTYTAFILVKAAAKL